MLYLAQSRIFEVAQNLNDFSITWASEHGHWVHIEHAVLTSRYSEGGTIDIKNITTGDIHTVIIDTIRDFAGKEVII